MILKQSMTQRQRASRPVAQDRNDVQTVTSFDFDDTLKAKKRWPLRYPLPDANLRVLSVVVVFVIVVDALYVHDLKTKNEALSFIPLPWT